MVKRLGVQDLIHYTTISKYELDKNEPPLAILLAYARLAGIPVEQIIDDELELTIWFQQAPYHFLAITSQTPVDAMPHTSMLDSRNKSQLSQLIPLLHFTDYAKSHTGAFAASAVKSLRCAPMNSANSKQFAPPLTAFLAAA
jgi:transcriptional regulator with XRE-family HTH domain